MRKGKLRYLARASTAGHVFTVLDEQGRKLPDACDGTARGADERGRAAGGRRGFGGALPLAGPAGRIGVARPRADAGNLRRMALGVEPSTHAAL